MNRPATLEQLAQLCRTHGDVRLRLAIESTGFSNLDQALPNGGWQIGTIVELMPEQIGIGELRLLLPAIAHMTSERYVALIAPPYVPFAPAWAQHGVPLERLIVIETHSREDTLWVAEQTLRCHSFAAVVAWPSTIKDKEVRRLQLAAEAGSNIGFLYRPPSAALESSPAAMRLQLRGCPEGLQIDILKCRGGRGGSSVRLDNFNDRQMQIEAIPPSPHSLPSTA